MVCVAFFWISDPAQAQPQIELQPFLSGLSQPVGISHAGDDRLFIVGKRGRIYWVSLSNPGSPSVFMDISDRVDFGAGEEGLLGLAFHPLFAQNGYFYVNYTNQQGRSQVSRFSTIGGPPQLGDASTELKILSVNQPFENHNGGDIKFGPDGKLYIAFGDGGSGGDPQNNAQNGQTFLGKILRIDVDSAGSYSIPADNPFVGNPNVKDEIWSLGWRNPWRFSFDRQTGDMWVGDVGQNAFEEISMEPSGSAGGGNYGWRCFEAFAPFNLGGDCNSVPLFIEPIFDYINPPVGGRSITGGYVYRGSQYPDLTGLYLYGDYVTGDFWLLEKVQGIWKSYSQGLLMNISELSSFGEDRFGELYAAALNEGKVYKIKSQTTSLGDSEVLRPLEIYPVPASQLVRFSIPSEAGREVSLEVFDQMGRQVMQIRGSRNEIEQLNVSSWDSGLYLLRITGEQVYGGKFQVQR